MLSESAREQVQVLNEEIIRIVKEDHAKQHPEGACWVCGRHGRTRKDLRMFNMQTGKSTSVTPAAIGLKGLILCMPHEISLTQTIEAIMYNTYHQGYPQTLEQLRTRFAYWLTKQLVKQAKLLKHVEETNEV
jgi:hypothetical protein